MNGLRWGLMRGHRIGYPADPYIDRLRLIATPWLSVFIHRIHRPDDDLLPHDHPWAFWSMVLDGEYTEHVHPGKASSIVTVRRRTRFSVRYMSRRSAHRITACNGPLWTLVVTGPRRAEWGYWSHGKPIPWKQRLEAT